ncbi:Uncharacterised protein [Vibrio cholerae]|uniref:Uncharacterized protein n=1 Tax=Vibrio cholerae TaxID=666 RepID=A0A656AXW7_VIBCL|nr:Uncharacterised protein [Vibrio cholerae]CSC24104.1 Uncharacterised protein [Vibrio cholerae]CSD35955.1 Uncharacterised protein [Vibrio cholerae]CSD49490.1 Uncharacterised protein [Vibrio cholerae]
MGCTAVPFNDVRVLPILAKKNIGEVAHKILLNTRSNKPITPLLYGVHPSSRGVKKSFNKIRSFE